MNATKTLRLAVRFKRGTLKGESDPFEMGPGIGEATLDRTFEHTCHFDRKDGVIFAKNVNIGVKRLYDNEAVIGEA